MKNSNETIGNRARKLSACSAVPQTTAPPRTPSIYIHLPNKAFVCRLLVVINIQSSTLERSVICIAFLVFIQNRAFLYKAQLAELSVLSGENLTGCRIRSVRYFCVEDGFRLL
jgi:hypothetical protein